MNNGYEWATHWHGRGHHVFALAAAFTKKGPWPAWKKHQAAQQTRAELDHEFSRQPNKNLALCTWTQPVGCPDGYRLVVVDVDFKDNGVGNWIKLIAGKALPDTLEVLTPGGGSHLYFFVPEDADIKTTTGLLPGIDVRARGGSIVACGTWRDDGQYALADTSEPDTEIALAPDWLVEWLISTAGRKTASADEHAPGTIDMPPPVFDDMGPATDGREELSRDHVWAVWHELTEAQQWRREDLMRALTDAVWQQWVRAAAPKNPAKSLEQEGRGQTMVVQKCRECLDRHWNEDLHGLKNTSVLTSMAVPYQWAEASDIPPRRWLYGGHYIRGFVSMTAAPGGVGKSSLALVELISMVIGRDLLNGSAPIPQRRCWYVNLEDPLEELARRVQAIAKHYFIEAHELGGLFINSGRDTELVVARTLAGGVVINEPCVGAVRDTIAEHRIDCVSIDPFVHSHGVLENSNDDIAKVMKVWVRLAEDLDASVDLVHHMRKLNGEDGGAEDVRGGSAMVGAARSVRALVRLSKDGAAKLSIGDEEARGLFFFGQGKANLMPEPEGDQWRRLISVDLGNGTVEYPSGDSIGVVTPWSKPDPWDGITRQQLFEVQRAIGREDETRRFRHFSSQGWVGHLVGEVLDIDPEKDRRRLVKIIDQWVEAGALRECELPNSRRMSKPAVEVGSWAVE